MNTVGFRYCCQASEVGGFWEGASVTQINAATRRNGARVFIATVATPRQRTAYDNLKKAHFIEAGTYPGMDGTVHLMIKGLTKPRARSKRAAK